MRPKEVFTIGHSTHSFETFTDLLKKNGVQVVVDVRSNPYSRYAPQYNTNHLSQALARVGIKYLFMGKELGGRPKGEQFYNDEGYVLYSCIAQTTAFKKGILRLESGLEKFKVAIMCSEEDPTACHRRLLIGRVLREHGVQIKHIRGDGGIQTEKTLITKMHSQNSIQMTFFQDQEADEWKSIRSVLPKGRPKISLEH